MNTGSVTLLQENDEKPKDVIDDIFDEMIEMNMNYGGNEVFLPKGSLNEFNGFGAITRYSANHISNGKPQITVAFFMIF